MSILSNIRDKAVESFIRKNETVQRFGAIQDVYIDSESRIANVKILLRGESQDTLFRAYYSFEDGDKGTELVFDNATLVPTKDDTAAAPWFLCTKPGSDQIRIFAGGLKVDTTNDVTLAAPLVGAGGLVKLGTGVLTLASTNSYTGATVVSNGTLRLTGRVAGPISVAPGATLALPIPAAGEVVPTVPSLVVEDGGNLAAIALALPEGVMRVDVLRTTGELSIPEQNRDAAGNVFFAKTTAEGCVLQYGKPLGLQILVR